MERKDMKEILSKLAKKRINEMTRSFLNNIGIATATERSVLTSQAVEIDIGYLVDRFEGMRGKKVSGEFRDRVGIRKEVGCIVYVVPSENGEACEMIGKMCDIFVESIDAVLEDDHRRREESV